MIDPTPGRIVWFYTCKEGLQFQPRAAIVAFAHSERLVNLGVFTENGDSYPQTSVKLLQDNDSPPAEGCFATWMPYQKEQAKNSRLDEIEKQLAALKVEQGKPFAQPAEVAKPSIPTAGTPVSASSVAAKK